MIKVRINETERLLADVDADWLHQQINRRKSDGYKVCVRVLIDQGNLNMTLSTPECPKSQASSRKSRPEESQIFNIWERLGLYNEGWECSQIDTFLNQLRTI